MTVETDDAPRRMPTFPSMPDVAESHPVAVWKADDYLLVLVTDLKPLSARIIGEAVASGLHYDAALAVVDRRINYPRMYITLERSIGGRFLCRFTEAGVHENRGLVDDMSLSGAIEAQLPPQPENSAVN